MIKTGDQAEVLMAKVVTMVCLFCISMLCGSLPTLISLRWDWFTNTGPNVKSNRVVMGMLAFGGGVLFATTFMHLLPEIDENIHLLQESGQLPHVPIYLAALIMCCGFFMMYLIEELVHLYIRRREGRGAGPTKEELPTTHSHFPVADDGVLGALRGLLIVLALSIHELFEGLAVGLEASAGNVWYMFWAVSAHKYIIAFCIGVELLAAGTRRWLALLYVFTFSFVSALGIGVGILVVGGAGAADAGVYSVVLQGIACGTLVYVVFFEIWKQERQGLVPLLWSAVGFGLMVCLELVVELAA